MPKNLRSEAEKELIKKLELNLEEYFKEAERIINGLKERKEVNREFLNQIEIFIEYAKNQVKNKDLSEEIRLKYLDLIAEEESLHYRINEDLKRNDELIKSIKKSTNDFFHW